MKRLLPLLLAAIGTGAGVGAAVLMPAPAPEPPVETAECTPSEDDEPAVAAPAPEDVEYVRLANQFVVPVLEQGRVGAMVVLSLSIEATAGAREAVFAREPKLRDALLQVLFDHANMGGFDGSFTRSGNLDLLRRSMAEVAREVMPGTIRNVLIVEIARQDI